MEAPKIEANRGFWTAALGTDSLRSRVAAAFLQQLATCSAPILSGDASTGSNNIGPPSSSPARRFSEAASITNKRAATAASTTGAHEPFESPHGGKQRDGTVPASMNGGNSPLNTHGGGSGLGLADLIQNSGSLLFNLRPLRLVRGVRGRIATTTTTPAVMTSASSDSVNSDKAAHLNAPLPSFTQQQLSHHQMQTPPHGANEVPQTPRSDDAMREVATRQWRPLLMLCERVFGHGVPNKMTLHNRGGAATRASALGETWSAFLDAKGHVRLTGSGAPQQLHVRPNHRFSSIAWVGDFIALIDDKKDLYIARVSGSSSGLRGGHVLPAFVAPEGHPQKLLENVDEVSGTASGLLVLNSAGEVFFFSVQKPRQAPAGGVVPFRRCASVLLSPQLDIFVLDGTTKMLQKCSLQQHGVRPNTPRGIVSLRVQIKALAAGHRFLCCVDNNGALWVMGWNEVGQLGVLGTDHVRSFLCHEEMSRTAFLTDVACGKRHSVVLSIDGNVYVAGSNKHGQIGVTLPPLRSNSALVNRGGATVISTAAGGAGATAVAENSNPAPTNDPGFPIARRFTHVPLSAPCVSIACGPNASMFVLQTFEVIVCGNNEFGQLGLSACVSVNPAAVPRDVGAFGLFGVDQTVERAHRLDPMWIGHRSGGNGGGAGGNGTGGAGSLDGGENPVMDPRTRKQMAASDGGGCCGCGGNTEPLPQGTGKAAHDGGSCCVVQ